MQVVETAAATSGAPSAVTSDTEQPDVRSRPERKQTNKQT
jgi:hypothetical protein